MFVVEAKLNPEAAPNPEGAAGLLEVGAPNEKPEAEGAEEEAEEPPNPEGDCVGAAMALPKAGAAAEPNPELEDAKLKELAWGVAGLPKPLLPKPVTEEPNPVAAAEPKLLEDGCGAAPFNSASNAARVLGFIVFSS